MELHEIFSRQMCPVCGFQLDFVPWMGLSASHEICPCCGIQFGYDDASGRREEVYDVWRRQWVDSGMKWWSKREKPDGFDPADQLVRLSQFMR
jgi:hypothetical protein